MCHEALESGEGLVVLILIHGRIFRFVYHGIPPCHRGLKGRLSLRIRPLYAQTRISEGFEVRKLYGHKTEVG